jgi:threonine/homoserine/homoserine lactone efflux protein
MTDVHWLLFVLASLALILTPGQDMMLVMSRSIAQGRAAGVATAAGVSVGLVGHTILVTLGLGAVILASEWLFVALKLVGAVYLVWLGLQLFRTKDPALLAATASTRTTRRLFLDGAFSNVSNPKIAVFYWAFLPQFVVAGSTHAASAIFAMGLAFAALTFIVKGPIALVASALSGWLRARPAALTGLYRLSGAVLVALGVRLAFERRP